MFAHITFHYLLCGGSGVTFLDSLNLPVHGCSPFCVLLKILNVGGLDRQGMWHVGTEIYAGFWFENLKDRECLEYTGINASIIFRWAIKKYYRRAYIGFL